MRNVKMALVVLALLAMAGTTLGDFVYDFGGVQVALIYQGHPAGNPAYESWLVRTTGAIAFEDISVEQPVVQVSQICFGTVRPTGYYDSIPGAAPAEFRQFDTHFLFSGNAGQDATFYAGGVTEGNDATLGAILPVSVPPWTAGMGGFNSDLAFSMLGTAGLDGLDLMQVVIPTGAWFRARGTAFDYYNGGQAVAFSCGPWIPEPSTIVMLVGGALVLVVVRLRRK